MKIFKIFLISLLLSSFIISAEEGGDGGAGGDEGDDGQDQTG